MNRVETNMIVSFHVAKTGGNTFATILERAATGLFSQDYGPDHPKTGVRMEGVQLTPLNGHHSWGLFDEMLTVPSIAARRNVLHGHLDVRGATARYPDADFVVWLRDPIDRVVSHYEFWKRLEVDFDDPLYRRFHDEGMSIEEFAAEPRVRNTQRRTTGWRPVKDFAFVGITEEYDRGLDLFGRMYDVDTSDIVQLNVNPHRKQSAYELPNDTRAVVESYNDGDLALYREAVERFEELDATTRRPFHPRRKLGDLRRRVRLPGASSAQPDDEISADPTQPE